MKTHGKSKTPEYLVWKDIIRRCCNPSNIGWDSYGGRGITVAKEWRHDFPAFLAYIGDRPSLGHSIDRINNDGNYEPGNVRWATLDVQRRNTSRNHWVTVNGKTLCLTDWEKQTGLRAGLADVRIREGVPEKWAVAVKYLRKYSTRSASIADLVRDGRLPAEPKQGEHYE